MSTNNITDEQLQMSAQQEQEPPPPPQQQQEEEVVSMPPVDANEHLRSTDGSTEPKGESEEEEVVVTLAEVLQEDAMLTEAADAVLGTSSETDCSYPMGYLRQALYACLTCTPESEDESARAGVCLVSSVRQRFRCAPHICLLGC